MALRQVGVMALRDPKGEFLPAVPIMREVSDDDETEAITMAEVEKIFVDRMVALALAEDKVRRKADERRKAVEQAAFCAQSRLDDRQKQ